VPRKPLKILSLPAPKPGQRCRVCGSPEIQRDLAEWITARRAGGKITFGCFYQGHLAVCYESAPSLGSVRGHLLRCLRLDPVTAKPL
jgi:hypothetical protein